MFKQDSTDLLNETGSLLDLEFPVRLGAADLRSDGLIGYFAGTGSDTYGTFYAVHRPQDALSSYVVQESEQNYLKLSPAETPTDPLATTVDTTGSQYVTMLLDPRCKVHAATGLLPLKATQLPERYTASALSQMSVTFECGPLLVDPEAVELPVPTTPSGTWTWIQPTGTGAGDWQEDPLSPADEDADLTGPSPILRDGWMRLSPHIESGG